MSVFADFVGHSAIADRFMASCHSTSAMKKVDSGDLPMKIVAPFSNLCMDPHGMSQTCE